MPRSLLPLAAIVAVLGFAAAAAAAPTPGGPAGSGEQPAAAEHAGAGHGEHAAHAEHEPAAINWYFGFLGEKEGVEPDVLWRRPGMPIPFAANLINAAVLFFILYRVARKPISEGLKQRKKSILAGMDEASRMKAEAERRLHDYEAKLEHIDDEIERVRRELKEAGEAERERLVAEARERRMRMERDAKLLVEQELKAAREALVKETVDAAVRSAQELLQKHASAADQQRLADEYVAGLGSALRPRSGARA